VEAAANAISDVVNGFNASTSRVIRITVVEAAFDNRLSAILEDFISTHGDVQFEFIPSDGYVDLSAGEADIAIRMTNTIDDQSLICRKITKIRTSLFGSQSYAAKFPLPTMEQDLSVHGFVVYKGENVPHLVNDWLLARIDTSQIAMTCPDMKSMVTAIQMGVGIGLLPTRFKHNTDGVVPCLELPEETATAAWLLVNPTAYRRPEVKAFTAFFAPRYSAMYRENEH